MFYLPKDERGQGMTEYVLVLVLVAIVTIAILSFMGPDVGRIFSRISRQLSGT